MAHGKNIVPLGNNTKQAKNISNNVMQVTIKGFGRTGGEALENDIKWHMRHWSKQRSAELHFLIGDEVSTTPSIEMQMTESEVICAQRIGNRLQQICGLIVNEADRKKTKPASVTATRNMIYHFPTPEVGKGLKK